VEQVSEEKSLRPLPLGEGEMACFQKTYF
jgi:hypothetical protein